MEIEGEEEEVEEGGWDWNAKGVGEGRKKEAMGDEQVAKNGKRDTLHSRYMPRPRLLEQGCALCDNDAQFLGKRNR